MSFEKYSNYNENAGVSSVVFGADKPVLEVELNEMQEVQKSMLRKTIKNLLGNGITDKKAISYANGVLSIANGCALTVNGYVVQCNGLSIPVTEGTVYLQVWEETVTQDSTLKKDGNEQSNIDINNYIRDTRSPVETTRRKVIKYNLALASDNTKQNLAIATITNGNMLRVVNEVNLAKLSTTVNDLQIQMGALGEGVLGLECDLDNNTFKRVGDNEFWSAGNDYENSPIYSGRKRCNVTDDGVIVAFYGSPAYTESGALEVEVIGTNGVTYPVGTKVQCMVMQPKFYYKRIPIRISKQSDPTYSVKGYHLHKWVDLISPIEREGFVLHPAFKKGDVELDYYFIGENDGCVEDPNGVYDMTDSMSIGTAPFTGYKFSSIAGAKPASGATVAGTHETGSKPITISAVRTLCANRGADWQQLDITIMSAEQMLFIIEYGTFNSQTTELGSGVTGLEGVANINDAIPTPSNTTLDNGSGKIASVYTHSNGTNYNVNIPVYRGVKNPYGNMWKFIDGIIRDFSTTNFTNNIYWQDGSKDFSNSISDYINSGFSYVIDRGYIKAFGYSEECDFMYMASLIGGSSNTPVGDHVWTNVEASGIFSFRVGGGFPDGLLSGLFAFTSNALVTSQGGNGSSGRLCRKSANVVIAV